MKKCKCYYCHNINSFSTFIPFSFRISAKTQSHFVNLQVKSPSKMSPLQHEGDFDFSIALLHHRSSAIARASWAHLTKDSVMSSQSWVMNLFHLFSQGLLGVESHQSNSGHTGVASHDFTMSMIFWFGQELQSYLQFIQAKQALTKIIFNILFHNVMDDIENRIKCKCNNCLSIIQIFALTFVF